MFCYMGCDRKSFLQEQQLSQHVGSKAHKAAVKAQKRGDKVRRDKGGGAVEEDVLRGETPTGGRRAG